MIFGVASDLRSDYSNRSVKGFSERLKLVVVVQNQRKGGKTL
jgi:hypothetical protein